MFLYRLWLAGVTKSLRHAGTDNPVVLTINQEGEDVLDRTSSVVPEGYSVTEERISELKAGQAFVWRMAIRADGPKVVPDLLTDSSIRIGLRGSNAWRPEHIVMWGELADPPGPVGLAAETDINVVLSADTREGTLTTPIHLVARAAPDAVINRVLVVMTTSDDANAGTNSPVEIAVLGPQGREVGHLRVPDTPQAEQERGAANIYLMNTEAVRTDTIAGVRVSILGRDAWLPYSFYAFGIPNVSGRPTSLVPLVHEDSWDPQVWLSADTGDAGGRALPSVTLDRL